MEYSYFDRFSSKIKRINIPIPSYNESARTDSRSLFKGYKDFWHYIVSAFDSKPKEHLIGRDIIIERLKTWLLKDRDRGASYLVTGYRGMGKTCFVNRVIEQLVATVDILQNIFAYFLFYIIAFWPLICYFFRNTIGYRLWTGDELTFVDNFDTFFFFFIPICFSLLWWMISRWAILREKLKKVVFYLHTLFIAIIKEHRWISLNNITPREWNRINNLIFGGDKNESSYSRICVKVNLGQEILREKDILSVLTYQLNEKWRKYCQSFVITDLGKSSFAALFDNITQMIPLIAHQTVPAVAH